MHIKGTMVYVIVRCADDFRGGPEDETVFFVLKKPQWGRRRCTGL